MHGLARSSLLALCAVTVLAESTSPSSGQRVRGSAFAGTNGRIAFASSRVKSHFQIFAVDPDGGSVVQLTTTTTANAQPAFAPDGLRIAFSALRDGNKEIYVMNADGSSQTRLTKIAAADTEPAWSPDGTRIGFVSARSGRAQIWAMNADGTSAQQLTANNANHQSPAWSPDGTKIAFADNRTGPFQIRVLTVGTPGSVALGPGRHPDWSPDGTQIAFDRPNGGVWLMNADGTGAHRIIGLSSAIDPSWSPDGKRIAYQARSNRTLRLFTATQSGASRKRITSGPKSDVGPSWGPVPKPSPPVPPAVGTSGQVAPVSGSVDVQLPGSTTFVPLDALGTVPIGSTVDTTKGTVQVVVSAGAGVVNTATFNSGVFTLKQAKHKGATADAVLTGSSFKNCPKASAHKSAHTATSKHHTVRKLWTSGSGNFRTVGKYASATVRGTHWETLDRCDGTLIRVRSGSVTVRDNTRHRNVVVRAHHSYLARKKRG